MTEAVDIIEQVLTASRPLGTGIQAELVVAALSDYIDIRYAELGHRDQNLPLVNCEGEWITFDTWVHRILGVIHE